MADLPEWYTNALAVVSGLVVGSFVNVIIARLPERQSLVHPRSRCPGCGAKIAWYDNIPVLSYLLLRGKCRHCKSRISVRYPVVELLTALLFLATKIRFGWSLALILRDWPFVTLLVAITFIDLAHRIIPDRLSLPGLAIGLATSWMVSEPGWPLSLAGAALGFGVFFFFAWLYERMTGRSGLGGGDIKLLAMLGAFLGPEGVITVIFASSVIGSVVGISGGLLSKEKNLMGVAIPYGPFLVIGALYYYLLGDLIWLPFTIPT